MTLFFTNVRLLALPLLQTWRKRVFIFVLSGLEGPSYATTSLALRIIWQHSSHKYVKVLIPSWGGGGGGFKKQKTKT
jgi:hypothetical protein